MSGGRVECRGSRVEGVLATTLFVILLGMTPVSLFPSTLDPRPSTLQTGFRALPATGVEMKITADGAATRIDFDFRGRGGYAIARLDGVLELPENFEFAFQIRGEAPPNTLEFKLIDGSGDNVWWSTRREFEFPKDWRRVSFKKRNIAFAWGPLGGGELPKTIGALEIVITAGRGGKGTVWIRDLQLLPLDTTEEQPAPSGPFAQRGITLDLEKRREFGGLTIDWASPRPAYTVLTSLDGIEFQVIRRVAAGVLARRDFIAVPDGDARHIRIQLENDGRIERIALQPVAWSKTDNDFFASIAKESNRGEYPRYLYNEQSFWTVVGEDGAKTEGLISEDGAIEAGDARFSIEPFLVRDGKLVTWADARATQSLERGDLPIPSVSWGDELTVTAAADASTLYARYRTKTGTRLCLAIRPFQVNPPWQFLARIGGVTKTSAIAWDGERVTVDAYQRGYVVPLTKPSSFGAATFDDGNSASFLCGGALPNDRRVNDPYGFASAAMQFDANDVTIAIPLSESTTTPTPDWDAIAAGWAAKLDRVTIDIPDRRIVNSIRSNLAYILINRDGPSIQPGSRSYDRSWIRDGSLTSTAMLRLGVDTPVREFIEWYAKHLSPDGYVPCCVGPAGADPVPEHDSHGQFIYLVAEYYRFTNDRAFLASLWPRVAKTVEFIDNLRHQRMTPQYANTIFYGLVPESISHEGYSAKAMHSYWDDLFILRGLKDAAFIASELGKRDDEQKFAAMRDEFRGHLVQSIIRTMAEHKIDYIPGSAELGDFDATSTTVFISPGNEHQSLPKEALYRTFDKYYARAFSIRDYTPYEWRTVGSFIRLGERERALELIHRLFRDQRPPNWNHWAEVVYANPREPKFIGDMPHTWVGSDFIRSILDMFAWERESDRSLVVGAVIPMHWLTGNGVRIAGLRTHYGPLSFSVKAEGEEIRAHIGGEVRMPPGGIIFVSPIDGRETVIRTLPAHLRLTGDQFIQEF
ncbi:MAG: coagulation factor 5/8 type domain-containing protein [Thermoanaerobaculia bacterium]|nr:coagulation factor 5/8 type domain-containing protein [Thermoanaerobaculia bacterium]